jgi:cytochrome c-L
VAAGALLAFVLVQRPEDAPAQTSIDFRNAFDGSVLNVNPKPGEMFTDAVRAFHASGRNVYSGDVQASAAGKALYQTRCQSCHLPDGSGRIGPSLIGDDYTYERVATDAGMFEVICGGAAGVMQSFANRMSQDNMLKLIAYVRSLDRKN